jgi:hypothetical protein
MPKKRNRSRPSLSLQERLCSFAETAREAAGKLPAGPERERLSKQALANEGAARIERWLSSPGLQRPTG